MIGKAGGRSAVRMIVARWATAALLAMLTLAYGQAADSVRGILFSESFDDGNLLQRGWYDGSKFTIAEKDPYAGRGSIEYGWIEKGGRQVVSSAVRRLFTPTGTVYLRFYIRLSPGWGWSGQNYHPHLANFLTTENDPYRGPAASHLTLYVEPVAGKLRLGTQDIQNKDAPHGLTQGPLRGGYNGQAFDSADKLFNDDKWHCVEAMFKLNTVDAAKGTWKADGIVRGWFDGRLVVDRTDVVLRSADFPNMKFNQFLLAPYFGVGLVPHAQRLWIDELAVGTERIGPYQASGQGAQSRATADGARMTRVRLRPGAARPPGATGSPLT